MTSAEATLMVNGYRDRMMRRKEIAVIAACGPYDKAGIEQILGMADSKPRRSAEDEAALLLRTMRKKGKLKDAYASD